MATLEAVSLASLKETVLDVNSKWILMPLALKIL